MAEALRRARWQRPLPRATVSAMRCPRASLWWAGLTLALLAGGCARSPSTPPNVLLIVVDTTRADAMFPVDPTRMPTFARLAREGTSFSHARSTSAWTLPSHGSLFTGLYPSTHGAHHESHLLRPGLETLAEVLSATHRTAGFSENPHIGVQKGFAQGFSHFEETWRQRSTLESDPPTVERVLGWLSQDREDSRPFFAFVNLMDAHLPYAPPSELARRYAPAGAARRQIERLRHFRELDARRYVTGRRALSDSELAILRSLYRTEVVWLDRRVGKLIEALDRRGDLDRTLVVIVGDHGENIADHGLMEHQLCLYETLLRVPLLFRLPGSFERSSVRDAAVQLVDVMPTILDSVGTPRSRWPAMQGQSLLHGDPPPERAIVAQYMRPVRQRTRFAEADPSFDFDPYDRRLQSYQRASLKLIVSSRGEVELYDLASDPREAHDLARERPATVRELAAGLERWSRDHPTAGGVAAPTVDRQTLDALKALGYAE
ncbi:MAG: sulfatase [Myxococcota bacterium]